MHMIGEAVISLAAEFLPRLRFLSVATTSHEICYAALRMLETPAPSLDRLKFNAVFDIPNITLPSNLLGGEPGHLRSLELHNMAPPLSVRSYPALSKLRSLAWHDRRRLVLDATAFCRLISLLPALETLRLSTKRFSWEECEIEPPGPHKLVDFALVAEDSVNMLACVQHLSIPRFEFYSASGYVPFLEELVRQPLSVRLGIARSEVVPEISADPPLAIPGDDAMVMVVGAPLVDPYISPALFVSLTQLSMYEFRWPSADIVLPPLPMLHTLRLTLASCASYSRYWISDAPSGILLGFDLAAWDAPALSAVHLDYWPPKHLRCRQTLPPLPWQPPRAAHHDCSVAPLAISLLDVYHFVRVCLPRTHGQRFSEIRLRGVEPVDPDPWLAFDLLKAMADDVSVSDVAEPTQFDIEDQRTSTHNRTLTPSVEGLSRTTCGRHSYILHLEGLGVNNGSVRNILSRSAASRMQDIV
ncbi:hypothetical protein AURDEDRAFT_162032 [Auricularia subglabra TFB-10046 SS5]|nr:hypothetical protein AURDEDRAFT_162032 [Auricularia subglabra TFB-10046 SS5]